VTHLRNQHELKKLAYPELCKNTKTIYEEAADEIERLRKRLEVYENALNVIDTTISMTDWKAHLVSDGVETADEIVIALVKECADD